MIKNKHLDIIIKSASQLVTAAANIPKTGSALQNLGIIEGGAIGITDGIIACVGSSEEILKTFTADTIMDASQKVVMPGFVDPHTHPIFSENP